MKLHFAIQYTNRQGATITSTLCGRSSAQEVDGFNSTENQIAVTCQLCRKELQNKGGWRYRKYIACAA